MKLVNVENERELWEEKGYEVFSFDKAKLKKATYNHPKWIHFGAGNLFRAYQAVFQQTLIEKGITDTGVIAVGGRSSKNVDDYFLPFDSNHISVVLKADGQVEKKVVGSVVDTLKMEQLEALANLFAKESLQVISFTITEKGYRVNDDEEDFNREPFASKSYLGRITALLYSRYLAGGYPLAVVSMDNCSHNGDVLRNGIMKYVKAWDKEGFEQYINTKVSFPISMIDKITPRPDKTVLEILEKDGVEDLTDPSYYMNCFVNAEATEYLVIEDDFPNGKPAWDQVGVIFTDRETVDKVEKMKVCTFLNPVHTALAIFGNLLGYKLIWKEMKDETLVKLVKHIGYDEGLPVVVDPGILNPKEFIDTVINERVTNPFMPDAPQRIGMDTSQKIPVRFGETIKAYIAKGMDVNSLVYIPLTLAGWLRYLMGKEDNGEAFEIPSDPMLSELCPIMNQFTFGDTVSVEDVKVILTNKKIFGSDLVEIGLAQKVVDYFNEMLAGFGAVRATLEKYV